MRGVSTIAHLKVGPIAQYAGSCPKFSEPKEVACFSRGPSRSVVMDRSSLREYVGPQLPAALDVGFETYVPKDNADEPAPLGDVFSALQHRNQQTDGCIVTFRNNLNKLMLTPYSRRDDWEMGVARRPNGCVTLNVRETARKVRSC